MLFEDFFSVKKIIYRKFDFKFMVPKFSVPVPLNILADGVKIRSIFALITTVITVYASEILTKIELAFVILVTKVLNVISGLGRYKNV